MAGSLVAQVSSTPAARGTLCRFDIILFSVTAILCLSQVPISAGLGQSVIVWTAVVIFLFFVPYGLITAESDSTYPDAGGIYSRVSVDWSFIEQMAIGLGVLILRPTRRSSCQVSHPTRAVGAGAFF